MINLLYRRDLLEGVSEFPAKRALEIRKHDNGQVRFRFRHMPLDMHPWARPAAELAACVQMQSGDAFWKVHDYLFEHQQEANTDNLQPRLMDFIGSLDGVRVDQVKTCTDQHLASPRIQKDVALAAANNVHGTPTIFVNGEPTNGALTREYLLTLIRENSVDASRRPKQ